MDLSIEIFFIDGGNLSKWAQMMRDYVTSRKRDDQCNIGTEEALQEDRRTEEGREGERRADVLLRDAPTDSVEEKHKSQKKGLFSFGPVPPAKEDSKEERSKSREKAEQDDSENKDVAVGQKVRTILQAFSADHDIFWFRYILLVLLSDQ